MKVGIIGYGFVGKALENGLKESVKLFKVDPTLNTSINDLEKFNPDICFICVPTPMNDDGSQDISILQNVINEIVESSISALIVIKSTVLPIYINLFEKKIAKLVFNPEFLREKHANEDFINSDLIVFGGDKKVTKILGNFYKIYTKCKTKSYQFTDSISASLIKYAINSFLSSKVIFFNELYEIFNKSGSKENWEHFIKIISNDKRMGNSHMMVPGIDGRFGFGGPCFPKDCNALIKYSENIDSPFKLLQKVKEINNNIRSQYEDTSDREKDQNINYNENIL